MGNQKPFSNEKSQNRNKQTNKQTNFRLNMEQKMLVLFSPTKKASMPIHIQTPTINFTKKPSRFK